MEKLEQSSRANASHRAVVCTDNSSRSFSVEHDLALAKVASLLELSDHPSLEHMVGDTNLTLTFGDEVHSFTVLQILGDNCIIG